MAIVNVQHYRGAFQGRSSPLPALLKKVRQTKDRPVRLAVRTIVKHNMLWERKGFCAGAVDVDIVPCNDLFVQLCII